MRYIIVDTEVFAHDNLVVFKDYDTKQRTIYCNDNDGVHEYFDSHEGAIFVGANIKHYDIFILKAMYNDFSPEEIKQLNDYIIEFGGNGWEYPPLRECFFNLNIFDLFDDMQQGLGLKSIEAHLGMDIEETQVDFNLDRRLTQEEIELTIKYCSYDVDATEKLFEIRASYRDNKLTLAAMAGIAPEKALRMTNATLTAKYLSAQRKEFDDEREYVYPDNLLREYIPQGVFDYFNWIYDKSISDEELFKAKYESSIGDCSYTLGFGGIHGCLGKVILSSTEDEKLANDDVASYYPHLMTINGYCSRAIPNPEDYEAMLERRMQAKRSGDKPTNNALKLVANTTYGAMLAMWNDLYDPKMGRSVCISGQLYLLELGYHLATIPSVSIVQMNTDGIMYRYGIADEDKVNAITEEWQKRTGFELERDYISKVVQKDVNNYIEIKSDDSFKVKGGYLTRGIAPAGAFNINNNFTIVPKAVIDYFTKGIPVEETINACIDILEFQIVAKAGGKYNEVYHYADGVKVKCQNVNRVYASPNHNDDTIYKVHAKTGASSKIPNLPRHCLIDNKNELTIADIDKGWYIKKAQQYVNDYLGKRTKVKRTNTRKINTIKKSILSLLEV